MRVRYRDKKRLSVYNVYLETGGGSKREREKGTCLLVWSAFQVKLPSSSSLYIFRVLQEGRCTDVDAVVQKFEEGWASRGIDPPFNTPVYSPKGTLFSFKKYITS